jgi:hypothetical protein
MRPRSSTRSALLLTAVLLSPAVGLGATPDRCQEDPDCREQTERAAQLAGQTKYQEALDLYQSAYDRVHEPRLLMNLGRCHFRLGRARKALELYASFQKAAPDPDPQLATRLELFITEAKRAVESDTSGQENPPGTTDKTPSGTSEVTLIVPPSPPGDEPPPADPLAKLGGRLVLGRPLYRVVLGGTAIGLGLVSLGLGIGALSANGTCVAQSESAPNLCAINYTPTGTPFTRVLDGITPGAPLLLVGVVLTAGGIALIAVPPRKPGGGQARSK